MLISGKTKEWLELELLAVPPTSGEQRRLEIKLIIKVQWFNQSCLYNKISIKKKKNPVNSGVWRASGWVTTEGTCSSPYLVLCISAIRLFLSCILYNELVSVSRVLSSIPWVNLANYRKDLQQSVGSTGVLRLAIGIRSVGAVLWDWTPNLCVLYWFQVVSVRIEINCRTWSWFRVEELVCVRKKSTHLVSEMWI